MIIAKVLRVEVFRVGSGQSPEAKLSSDSCFSYSMQASA